MMARGILISAGLFLLGIVLAVVGFIMTPGAASFVFPGPISEAGQSLIALGLTFVIVGAGLLLAGFEERMMPAMQ